MTPDPTFVDHLRRRLAAGFRSAFDGDFRKLGTPERALATIHKLETADLEEIGTRVYVWPEARGRVTGFFVGCEVHGGMPFLAPTKAKAHVAAARHVKAEHRARGTVVLRDRPLPLEVS